MNSVSICDKFSLHPSDLALISPPLSIMSKPMRLVYFVLRLLSTDSFVISGKSLSFILVGVFTDKCTLLELNFERANLML